MVRKPQFPRPISPPRGTADPDPDAASGVAEGKSRPKHKTTRPDPPRPHLPRKRRWPKPPNRPSGIATAGGKAGPGGGLRDAGVSGAAHSADLAARDAGLAAVVAAWPGLPAGVRRRVVELVRGAGAVAKDGAVAGEGVAGEGVGR